MQNLKRHDVYWNRCIEKLLVKIKGETSLMTIHYNLEDLKNILHNFYVLTKIKTTIFNVDKKIIASYPEYNNEFCVLLQNNPIAYKKCIQSDDAGFQHCKIVNNVYSYTCHAGLTEIIAPIRSGKIIIGYIMIGGVLQDENVYNHWPIVKEKCSEYGINDSELISALLKIKTISIEEIIAATQIMEACANHLWLSSYIKFQESSLPKQIYEYIKNNLESDLSVKNLCDHFGISRAKLYRLSYTYYGRGIEKIVREERINKAKVLLAETTLKISEVTYKVGFSDYNYFIKVFKNHTETTPHKYRKEMTKRGLE